MGENCKDCVIARTIERDIGEIVNRMNALEQRTGELERNGSVERERTDMIFKMLNEIKASIEEIKNRPNHLLWTIAGAVAVAIVMAGMKQIGA